MLKWFNYYGLIAFVILMIPNIIYAAKRKSFDNLYQNKAIAILEQVGRFGSFLFLIINIPYTWFGFFFPTAEVVYISVIATILAAYILVWVLMWNKDSVLRAVLLSALPSLLFLFSGIMILSVPQIVMATIFAVGHITLSVKNAILQNKQLTKG